LTASLIEHNTESDPLLGRSGPRSNVAVSESSRSPMRLSKMAPEAVAVLRQRRAADSPNLRFTRSHW
jgi:hypothetical protein